MDRLRRLRAAELTKVAEVIDRSSFVKKTVSKQWTKEKISQMGSKLSSVNLALDDLKMTMQGGLITYLLHCEARIASFLGRGYYTIGPCGEELLGFISLNFNRQDLTALHYRHLATSIVRQLRENKPLESIALDRARGFTCSIQDPVTAGRHCSIGGNHKSEFLVTSTLASQAPAAMGRALGISLSNYLLGAESNFSPDAISYVSLGDGSINNAHFLSALNLAKYSEHNKFKCPIVFAISDNKVCISLKGNGYLDKFVDQLQGMYIKKADGKDFLDVYLKSKDVIDYSRMFKRPSLLLLSNLPRRFGHAATDRQFAYLTAEEIQAQVEQDPLSDAFSMLINLGIYSQQEFQELFENTLHMVEKSFDHADGEPKNISRENLVSTTTFSSQARLLSERHRFYELAPPTRTDGEQRPEVMRKHMTRVFDELLTKMRGLVYIGEDVQHGGYYLVTDGLFKKHPFKVRDFPPDETTLIGAGIGFAQAGLVPIVEIPYAKYLDCGADMFYEAVISNWLSNCQQPNGMVIRLQGFDKGIFGGNYHTHNMLSFPPGLDVVCFSNGGDYVRGMRHLVDLARKGRVVMSVDSTDLLNRRHLSEEKKDEFMLSVYPVEDTSREYDLDEVTIYRYQSTKMTKQPKVVIITYGNGVPTAALAQVSLAEKYSEFEFIVIDTPCLSKTPGQLKKFFRANEGEISMVVFADVCKFGAGMPLSARLIELQNENLMRSVQEWKVIGASPTYNPLGTYLTFLSKEDIMSTVESMIKTIESV